MLKEILDTQEAIQKRQVCRPRLPVLRMELSITLFNTVLTNPSSCGMDSLDWKTHNTTAILNEVEKEVKPGLIILMHDIHQTTIDALPTVPDYPKSQGYTL